MKPFDPTKPVQTRDGRKARIICTDYKNGQDSIVAAITRSKCDEEMLLTYSSKGWYQFDEESQYDLVNIPEKITGYVNVYRGNIPEKITGYVNVYRGNVTGHIQFSVVRPSAVSADNEQMLHRIARVKVEFEEGQFDE
jgi:hypothetical protein